VVRRLEILAACLVLLLLACPDRGFAQDDDDSAAPETSVSAPVVVRVEPPPPPPDPDVLWAQARQVTLPAWGARAEAAAARADAARAYFSGTASIDVAFPALARGPHHSQPWLAAGLIAAQGRESSRLRERAVTPPDFGDARRTARWTAARAAALDAEDLADAQQRRLLLGLQAIALDRPGLAGAAYAEDRARLEARIAGLEARWTSSAEGPARDRLATELAAVQAHVVRLDDQARAVRRWATVPGSPPPSPAADLAELTGPNGEEAAERLQRLEPILTPGQRHEVNVALVNWLQDTVWPTVEAELSAAQALEVGAPEAAPPSRWTVQSGILADTEVVATCTDELATLGGRDDSVSVLQRRILEARRGAARHRLAAWQVFLARSARDSAQSLSRVEAELAGERAESARREADRAAQEASDVQSRRIASALEEVATIEAEAKTAWDALGQREALLGEAVADWQTHMQTLDSDVESIRDLPPGLGSQRRARSAKAWRDLHGQLTALRRGAISAGEDLTSALEERTDVRRRVDESRAAMGSARTFSRSLPVGPERASLDKALEQWEAALESRTDAAERRVTVAEVHRETVLELLQDEKLLRDRVRDDVPRSARDKDREVLFEDLSLELSLVVPNMTNLARNRLDNLTALPRSFQQLDRLWAGLVSSFWLLLATVIWLWARARVKVLIPPLIDRLKDRRARLFTRSFKSLREPLTRVAQAAVDLFAVALLLGPVNDRLPELAFVLVLYRLVVLYRLFDGLFRLAVAPADENRPALLAVRRETWTVSVRATRLLLLWLILGNFVQYICRDLLGADALGQVLGSGFSAAFVVLSLLLLHQAEPHLRHAMAKAPESALQSWLARPPANPLVSRAPRGLLSLLFIMGIRLWQLLQGNVDEGSALGSFLNVLNRRLFTQRHGADAEGFTTLSPTVARRIHSDEAKEQVATLYPDLDASFEAALDGWQEDEARGLVLLVGDRGQGKQVWARRVLDKLETVRELPTLRARLGLRLVKPGHLFGYLAREWGLGQISSAEEFERAVKKLPPTCFLVEEIEFAFLRRVGGFAALHAFFRVVTATSSEHFWLLTVHAPAWRLLERIGTVANPNSFRSVLEIPRLSGSELGQYLGTRTAEAGFRPDFGALSSGTPAGQPAAEAERTAEAFFRLLADAAGGNPGIALPLWTASLSRTDDPAPEPADADVSKGNGSTEMPRLLVRLPEVIVGPALPPLSDAALLTLAAVRVHGFLNVDEIVQANNMEPDLVRTTAQVLDNLGLLHRVDSRYQIAMKHLPAITRLLRRRHFVYGKDQV